MPSTPEIVLANIVLCGAVIAILALVIAQRRAERSEDAAVDPRYRQIEVGVNAKAVIDRMVNTYRSLATYTDTGDVHERTIAHPRIWVPQVLFWTTFQRDRGLVFLVEPFVEWERKGYHWLHTANGRVDYREHDVPPDSTGTADPWSRLTERSFGATHCVLPLLCESVGAQSFAVLRRPRYIATEMVLGHWCYRIRGSRGRGRFDVWIDRETHLLRKIAQKGSEQIYLLSPKAGVAIKDDAFLPPGPNGVDRDGHPGLD